MQTSGTRAVMGLARQVGRQLVCSRGSRGVNVRRHRAMSTTSLQMEAVTDGRFLKRVGLLLGAVGISGFAVARALWPRTEAEQKLLPAMMDQSVLGQDDLLNQYSVTEIQRHRDMDAGVWVTYGETVYDISEFIESHPGGEKKIMLAAGGPLEPHWDIYTMHKSQEIREMLDCYKIGTIKKDAAYQQSLSKHRQADPYRDDPVRSEILQVNCDKPFDADLPSKVLVENYYTPSELFYVRNHLPVPVVDPAKYELEVSLPGKDVAKISLHDLKTKFQKHHMAASLQCAGNRRDTMAKFKQVYGMSVGHTQISNAEWTGVYLRDVLHHMGIGDIEQDKMRYVELEGLDKDPSGAGYRVSIPIEKAVSQTGDVLLAFEMNGEDLPRDHGYPVRVVVPGMIGARSVKWLSRIEVKEEESTTNYQKNDYKSSPPSVQQQGFSFHKEPPINEMPVNSAICRPASGDSVEQGAQHVTVSGYAISGGGNSILRVDVSADGGETWQTAELQACDQKLYRAWGWTLWKTDLPITTDHQGELKLVCKAVDSAHNVQPEGVAGIWNIRGYLNNAWHSVHVSLLPENEEAPPN